MNCFRGFNTQYSDIFCRKNVSSFCKSYSHFFSKKIQHICVSLDVNFNKSLTNDVVSFEQLGPDIYLLILVMLNKLGVAGWGKGVMYLALLGHPTDIGLQLGKAYFPCNR